MSYWYDDKWTDQEMLEDMITDPTFGDPPPLSDDIVLSLYLDFPAGWLSSVDPIEIVDE